MGKVGEEESEESEEMKKAILAEIEKYLSNCKTTREAGAMSQFGSVSGAMMLKSAEQAFEELKTFVENLEEEK